MSPIELLIDIEYKEFKVEAFRYKVTSFNKVELIGYSGNETSITIPSIVVFKDDVYHVHSIGKSAFKEKKLNHVSIPDGVVIIQDFAFSFNELSEITIPESVHVIGEFAFTFNKISSLCIPNSVTDIGIHAFAYNKIAEITFSESLVAIQDFTFIGNKLTAITIPSSIISVGEYAFYGNLLSNIKLLANQAMDFPEKTFIYKHSIDLIVPRGCAKQYSYKGWTGFCSIKEE